MLDKVFTTPSGRKLGYAIYGPQDGFPVWYFYGTPSSRLEPLLLKGFNVDIDRLLGKYGVRFIAVDRPGIGTSGYYQGSIRSFADGVSKLGEHLQISSAGSLSWSGGTPYSLTHAFLYSEQVSAVYIITGFTRSFSEPGVFQPMKANKIYFGAAKYAPWLLKTIMNLSSKKESDKPMPRWLSRWPKVDFGIMNDPARMKAFSRNTTVASCTQGARGIVHEANLYFDKSAYDLRKFVQPIHFWWGTDDNVVLPMHYQAVEQHAPKHFIHLKEGEGHISIYIRYLEEVLGEIVAGTKY